MVIFWILGVFWSFSGFEGILVIFLGFESIFVIFLGFRGILVIFRFWGILIIFEDFRVLWSFSLSRHFGNLNNWVIGWVEVYP